MQKKLCFVLSLTVVCYWAEASPVKLGTSEFDKLDADLDNLNYEVEEEDLDDYSKLLDDAYDFDKDNSNVKTSGFKKKSSSGFKKKSKGAKANHDIKDLKKFFKTAGVKEQGKYDDNDVYAAVKALAAEAVGVKGTEERKYKKGTKTRGFHRVHHKDEYKKDKEFYEDDETAGAIKKVGGKALGFKIGGGAGFNKGHFKHDHRKGIYGKEGFVDKGFIDKKYSDFSDDQGFEGSFDKES